MNKYTTLYSDIWAYFETSGWKAEGIASYPADVIQSSGLRTFIKISTVINNTSQFIHTNGMLLIDIYTTTGEGPLAASLIADKLDTHFAGKTRETVSNCTTQFQASSLDFYGADKANPSLSRHRYSIPFNYYGT